MSKWRQYLASIGIALGVFLLAAVASGAPGGGGAKPDDPPDTEGVTSEQEPGEGPGAGEKAGWEQVNHGRCVSFWVQQAHADLEGKAGGEFASLIAQKGEDAVSAKVAEGETPDETCAFQADLDAAKAAAAAESASTEGADHGQSGEEHGKGKGLGRSHRP